MASPPTQSPPSPSPSPKTSLPTSSPTPTFLAVTPPTVSPTSLPTSVSPAKSPSKNVSPLVSAPKKSLVDASPVAEGPEIAATPSLPVGIPLSSTTPAGSPDNVAQGPSSDESSALGLNAVRVVLNGLSIWFALAF
ncbi:hypothetical protein ACFX1Q_030323 [Malus domestica]|uniref:classical arabinogalactan protein 5-like n=1 Tax=Malus domestica TaxID=3750 RepID=UPI003977053F